MAIDYVRLLRDLVDERESWARKRDDAEREISRLSELIRSTVKMLSPDERSRCECETLLERIDNRPYGLTTAIRGACSAGKEWLTPVEIRDYLKSFGFNLENYKANPLTSIHTTLRRMVPHEVECRIVGGQKLYRLKTVELWRSSIAEAGKWLKASGFDVQPKMGQVVAVRRRKKDVGEGG